MNRAQWIAKKNEIRILIKKISNYHGGDEKEWLEEYFVDRIECYKDNLNALYASYFDVANSLMLVNG